ncbi:hypothetical protein YK48G_12630 [Lentilactobacillus fungorum]|uniref:Uncharacterized protein n=1 Tax=Lentilactobacillus fungorum TaxID=2201250 RepID=A0ABQ3VZJ2_9LACO|nr:hypothetical protein YK48G_12630 [Lentilactobacillus fungorum]
MDSGMIKDRIMMLGERFVLTVVKRLAYLSLSKRLVGQLRQAESYT